MIADILLSRLDKVRALGNGRYMACCPAHDDKSPSLAIREIDDRVLINCFAGCHADDVLAAVDLKWADLFADKWDAAKNAAYHGRQLKPVNLDELDRRVIEIAEADIKAGRDLSVEDQARLSLALERQGVDRG